MKKQGLLVMFSQKRGGRKSRQKTNNWKTHFYLVSQMLPRKTHRSEKKSGESQKRAFRKEKHNVH